MAITAGTYRIITAMDAGIVLDVEGNSQASGANIELWGANGGLNQVWDVQVVSGSYCRIVSARSGLLADSSEATPVNGKNIIQWAANGGNNQQWLIAESGSTKTINGTAYPTYYIRSRMNTTYVMDASGQRSAPGTNVQLWQYNGGLNQQWVLMPVTVPSTRLQAPVGGGLSTSATSGGASPITVPTSTTAVYPSWRGAGTRWQVRYRTAVRARTGAAVGAWSTWRCLADGSTANDGWGAVGTTVAVTVSGGRIRASSSIATTFGTTNDKVRVQFEARRYEPDFENGFNAHGTAAAFTVDANAAVTVGVSSMTWTPGGVLIVPTPSNGRDDNSYRIWINGLSKRWESFAGVASGDYCTCSNDNLKAMPVAGRSYTVQVRMTTRDKVTVSASVAVTCRYSSSHGLSFTLTPVRVSAGVYTVNLSAYPVRHVWVVEDGDAHEMKDAADGVTWVAAPQGRAFSIYAQVEDASGNWGTQMLNYGASASPVATHRFVWEGGYKGFRVNKDAEPLLNVNGSTNTNASLMTGGTYEAVSAGEGRMVTGSLAVALVYDSDLDLDEVVDAMEEAVFMWYSGLKGQLWRIAVESIDTTRQSDQYAELTISWRRVDG